MSARVFRFAFFVFLAAVFAGLGPRQPDAASRPGSLAAAGGTRFEAIDLFIDPAGRPVAAYQVEFRAASGRVKIVGVEGGEHAAFRAAPYYDPAAIQNERVVIGALSTLGPDALPAARTRIARVHVMIEGAAEPTYELKLQAAAGPDTNKMEAAASFAVTPGEAGVDEGEGS